MRAPVDAHRAPLCLGRRTGESFLATTHGRDQIQYAELAARRDGRIIGLRTRLIADLGAYALGMGPGVPAINTGLSVTGPYRIRMSKPR